MARLIDADELINCLDYCAWNDATEVVREQPTAFDLDAVILKLEAHIKYNEMCEEQFKHSSLSFTYKSKAETYKNALEIIRSGGRSE